MTRKFFVLAGILSLLVAWSAVAGVDGAGATRMEQKLGQWKFFRGDLAGPGEALAGNSSFETAYIPHTMFVEPRLYKKGETYFRGVGWYVTRFTLDPAMPRGQVRLQFEAAMARADVWLNGASLGAHLGGYTPFQFDITSIIKSEGENWLVVKVDNRVMEVPPDGEMATQDYTLNGGIYREVRIVGWAAAHVDDIYVIAADISDTEATIKVETKIENTGASAALVTARIEVFEVGSGAVVLKLSSEPLTLEPNRDQTLTLKGKIANPKLWSPDQPNLYRVQVDLVGPGGQMIDTTSTRTGIRKIEFTPDRGFFLNGKPLKLIGPNRHQTYSYLGNAVPDRYQRWDAQFIKDQGFNFVRCSHYPQSPAFLDACDELGIMVFEELPGWHYIGGAEWKDLALQAVREMILRDRNRPSIILWGVRINESIDDVPFTDRTNALAHQLDPTRPTTGARIVGSYKNYFEDVISINDYTVTGPNLPADKPHLLSETVGVNYQVKRGGKPVRERNYLEWHLYMLNRVFADPRCAGEAFWELHDTNTFMKVNYMGIPASVTDLWLNPWGHIWHWGVSDGWHIPKESLYAYTSQFNEAPFIRIAAPWDQDALRDIVVLHNCDEVELSLNGRSLGSKKPDPSFRPNRWIKYESWLGVILFGKSGVKPVPKEIAYRLPHPPTTFKNIKYYSGELTARCLIGGEVRAEHTRRTPGAPAAVVLKPDFTSIVADGSDMTRVVIELVDANGTLIHTSNAQYQIKLSGPARLLADSEPILEAGMAGFYVQSNSLETGTAEARVTFGQLGITQRCVINLTSPSGEQSGW